MQRVDPRADDVEREQMPLRSSRGVVPTISAKTFSSTCVDKGEGRGGLMDGGERGAIKVSWHVVSVARYELWE